jgi:hypothetical protein
MVLSDKGFRQAPFERSTPKLPVMTYVIGKECVDVMHRDCVQECPADRIYERALPEDERRSTGISGGACRVDRVGVDTPYVTSLPVRT